MLDVNAFRMIKDIDLYTAKILSKIRYKKAPNIPGFGKIFQPLPKNVEISRFLF